MNRRRKRQIWGLYLRESYATLSARPLGTVATALATSIGVAAAIGVLNVSAAAQGQVADKFNAGRSRDVVVSLVDPAATVNFPADTDRRIAELPGVESGGWLGVYDNASVAAPGPLRQSGGGEQQDTVIGASEGALRVALPRLLTEEDRRPNVLCARCALLGVQAARQLGYGQARSGTVFINGLPFKIVGQIADVARRAELLSAVVVARSDSEQLLGDQPSDEKLVVRTVSGGARQVARQIRQAVAPTQVDRLRADAAPDPDQLRSAVSGDLTNLVLAIAVLSMLTGAGGIAMHVSGSVRRRTAEFGVRRALGATRSDISRQVLLDSLLIGLLGSGFGASIGIGAGYVVALVNHWTPTVDPVPTIAAPILGLMFGLLAGILPARRSGRIEPTEALRS